jgi:outer membrane receptor protein involved in Fe transport
VTAANDALPSSSVNTAFGKNVAVLMGSNFADNKGNATAYVTYDHQGAALQGQFDYSACTLAPNAALTKLHCAGSGTSAKNGAGGYFQAYPSAGGAALFTNTVDGGTGLMRPFDFSNDLFNYGPLNFYQTPNERWTAGTFVNYDVTSHVNVYAEAMYMRNSSSAQIAPSGDFFLNTFIPCASPLLTAQEAATMCTPANLAANGGASETFNGVTYPGLNMYIGRRNVEGGNRIATFITNSAREVLGIKGDFADAWRYDVYAQHATVDNNNGNLNYLSNTAIEQSLNVLPGPGGTAVCGGPTNSLGNAPLVPGPGTAFSANPACVPWNIWHPNGVTAAQTASLSVPLIVVGNTTEYVANGSVTGDLGKYGVKLPTADQGLQLNVGVEWRQEATEFLPDFLSQQGSAAGSGGATLPITGSFNVKEAFTEMRLPLASHAAFAEDLALEGGYRYSKYSLGFNTNTYKLGLEWAPVRDVRLRGSFQRAVRAPNIGELFTPQAVGLDGAHDPCAAKETAPGSGVLTNGVTFAQCALTGVTPLQFGNIGANPAFQYNGQFTGNPNLVPEVADTYTVGLMLQPRVVPNLSVSVDYFHIKIDGRVGPVGGDAILNNCITTGVGCAAIHRSPTGSLYRGGGFVDDPNVNQGSLKTSGVDLKSSYRLSLTTLGSLLFSVEGTYLKELITQPIAGGGSYDCTELFGAICGGGNPKWRHVFNATWSTPWDGLDLNLRWRHFGSDSSESATTNPFLQKTPYLPLSKIAAFNYVDLTGTFNLYKNVRLELGVNNIADKSPPVVVGVDCSTSSPAGANCNGNTFPGVYDAMGRYLFATITAQF